MMDGMNADGQLGITQSEESFALATCQVARQEQSGLLDQTHGDLDGTDMVKRLYPERQTSSRFSLKNPNARFSQTHDLLRQTIKEFRDFGKIPEIIFEDEEQDGDGFRGMSQREILAAGLSTAHGNQRGLSAAMLFQKQGLNTGSGAPSANLFACESLVNQTLTESLATHNNIDQLFTQA